MPYTREEVEASLRSLIDISETFDKQRGLKSQFVLTGGWAPYFITKGRFDHTGSRDLDFVLSNSIMTSYSKVAQLMKDALGFKQTGPFEFRKTIEGAELEVHFLCEPESLEQLPEDMEVFKIQEGLSAFIVQGCSLTFRDCFRQKIIMTEEEEQKGGTVVLVSGLVSTLALKARAFDSRRKPKDAYDIYSLVGFGRNSTAELLKELERWKGERFVAESIELIRGAFSSPDSAGTRAAATYLYPDEPALLREEVSRVYATVSEFVRATS